MANQGTMDGELSSEREMSDSEEEYKPLRFKSNLSMKKKSAKTSEPFIDVCSFTLGAFLAAPFMVFVCSAEDMLSGSTKATGLVFIAASAPSCCVKIFFLIFQGMYKTSVVTRCLLMYMMVVTGLLCVAMSHTSYNLRYVGLCFASLGMAIGEVHMLCISTQKLHKSALTSYIAGAGAGGLLSTLCYVGKSYAIDVIIFIMTSKSHQEEIYLIHQYIICAYRKSAGFFHCHRGLLNKGGIIREPESFNVFLHTLIKFTKKSTLVCIQRAYIHEVC